MNPLAEVCLTPSEAFSLPIPVSHPSQPTSTVEIVRRTSRVERRSMPQSTSLAGRTVQVPTQCTLRRHLLELRTSISMSSCETQRPLRSMLKLTAWVPR